MRYHQLCFAQLLAALQSLLSFFLGGSFYLLLCHGCILPSFDLRYATLLWQVIEKELLELHRDAGSAKASELQYDHQLCFANLLAALQSLLGFLLRGDFHFLLLLCHWCLLSGSSL